MKIRQSVIENFIFTLIIKVFYDIMILRFLPSTYLGTLTYGVDFVSDKLILGYVIYLLVSYVSAYYISKKKNNVSFGLTMLLSLYYVPISSTYYLNNTSIYFLLCTSLFFVLLPIINYYFFNIKENSEINTNTKSYILNNNLFVFLSILVAVMCVAYAYSYNGLDLSLDINSVYDKRAEFVGSTNEFTSILFHFGGQLTAAGALYGLVKKKRILFILCVFAQICIFSIARQKSDLLILIIVFFLWLVSKLRLFYMIKNHFSMLMCIATVATYLEAQIIGSTMLFNLFVRRIMYFPALLNYYYYDFFTTHKLLLFSQDVFLINRLGTGIYEVPVITLISDAYFLGQVPSPNTGLFGEAFMHFGYFGVILFPFIIIGLSKLFAYFTSIFPKEVQMLLIVQFFLSMMNIPITGGIFVITYFLWIPFAIIVLKSKVENYNVACASISFQ